MASVEQIYNKGIIWACLVRIVAAKASPEVDIRG